MSKDFRQEFPFFMKGSKNPLDLNRVYLDSAATSHRLNSALLASEKYYFHYNANVHRGTYELAVTATNAYEHARATIANFIGASNSDELVFTSGATEGLNLIANGLNESMLSGSQLLVCESEHHANLLPWQMLAKRFKLKLTKLPLSKKGQFGEQALAHAKSLITDDVALLAVAHASNALGNIYPVKELCKLAKSVNALTVIDGTQAAAHLAINVVDIDCDFYVFSGHKMYASTGVGAFYGRLPLLCMMTPSKVGGEMISSASFESFVAQDPPLKFEAGTPNIAGVLSMADAAVFCGQNLQSIYKHEKTLYDYLYSQMSALANIQIYGNIEHSLPIIAFNLDLFHCNDLATYLASEGIAVRAGHHCCMPLMSALEIEGCVRVSLACYNELRDIDQFILALHRFVELPKTSVNIAPSSALLEGNNKSQSDTEQRLLSVNGWNEKHRQLLLISKKLPLLPEQDRTETSTVSGCEASVWLSKVPNPENNERFLAYSNSKIVRGLLFVILDKANSLNSQQIGKFDFEAYLAHLGLTKFFSQGRRDGIQQIISAIYTLEK